MRALRVAVAVPPLALLGIHAGASVLSQAASGSYLAPTLDLPRPARGGAGPRLSVLALV